VIKSTHIILDGALSKRTGLQFLSICRFCLKDVNLPRCPLMALNGSAVTLSALLQLRLDLPCRQDALTAEFDPNQSFASKMQAPFLTTHFQCQRGMSRIRPAGLKVWSCLLRLVRWRPLQPQFRARPKSKLDFNKLGPGAILSVIWAAQVRCPPWMSRSG
jgi:hypothetical protein